MKQRESTVTDFRQPNWPSVIPTGTYRDTYPHDDGDGSGDVWDHYTMQFNIDSPSTPEVVKIWRNGALVGTPAVVYSPVLPGSFVNRRFFVGARSGAQYGLVGKLDELKAETASEYVNVGPGDSSLEGS